MTTSNIVLQIISLLLIFTTSNGQLSSTFYNSKCPNLQSIVRSGMAQAVAQDRRMGASILRLFFHDCFVNGCDGSILLSDTPTFTGEQSARPNAGSVRGYRVIDAIKSNVEAACRATVSCADILAIAARDAVVLLGGPSWPVLLGRRDATTASQSAANSNLPPATFDLPILISLFSSKGLNPRDLTALSGAHTIGFARCLSFQNRIYNEANIDPSFAALRQQTCPRSGANTNLAPLDVQTPVTFDNKYFQNLVAKKGLLHSDQVLFNNGSLDGLVSQYANNPGLFASDFITAMIKMGNISPLTGANGQIRLSCGKVN